MDWLVSWLLPSVVAVLGPAVVAGAKHFVPVAMEKVPKAMLPTVASLVSGAAAMLVGFSIPGVPPAVSAALVGLAGVGIREVYDQVRHYSEKNGF